MNRILALIAMAAMPAALAQNSPRTDQPAASNKVMVSRGQTVVTAVAGMAKAAGVLAALDPDIKATVSAATARLPLEQGLTVIAKANHAVWRKVYLAENEIPRQADGSINARALKQIVATVQVPAVANVGVTDPSTGQITVVTRAPEVSPEMAAWLKTRKAVYLLYSSANAPADTPGGGALPPGGLQALEAMTPDQRTQWLKEHNGVYITSDMAADERAQALQSLPAEERARIEEKMNQAAQNGGKSVIIMQHRETTQP